MSLDLSSCTSSVLSAKRENIKDSITMMMVHKISNLIFGHFDTINLIKHVNMKYETIIDLNNSYRLYKIDFFLDPINNKKKESTKIKK